MLSIEQQSYYAGAIYAQGSSSSTVKVYAENSILRGNIARYRYGGYGGGMYIWYGTVTLTSTTFASNSVGEDGGGDSIYLEIAVTSLCVSAASSPTQHHVMVMQYLHTTHQQ